MSFKYFLGFKLFLCISLLLFVLLLVPEETYAQAPQPTFVCLGGCPTGSPTPTIFNQNPVPTATSNTQPTATAATAPTTAVPAGGWIPGVNCIVSPSGDTLHAKRSRKKSHQNTESLLQKLIKLFEQLITLILQLLGQNTNNAATPTAVNPTQAPAANTAVNPTQAPAANTAPTTAGQNANQQTALPPCPPGTTAPTAAPQQPSATQAAQPAQPANTNPANTPATQSANTPANNVNNSQQCNVQPPPGAQAAGLTKLVFCEDFSDPSRIDFDNKPVAGKTTFVGMRPGNIFGAQTEVSSDFTWTPEGTLKSKSRHDNYQADFISTWPTGGGNHAGYDTGAKPFYTEASVKHNQWSSGGARGFFAFWAMDTCHLYNTGCSQFYEPDFYEFISRMHVNAFHWWSSSMAKVDSSCINTKSGGITTDGKDTQFNIYGAQFTNEGTNYYYNDKANITGACSDKAWSKNIPVGPVPGKTGKYPIIIGSGPNQPYEVDFVRVWQAP